MRPVTGLLQTSVRGANETMLPLKLSVFALPEVQRGTGPLPEGRRAMVARWSERMGVTGLLAKVARPAALTVLTYHRIGDPARTPFDAELFSATAADFESQIAYVRRHFRVLSMAEALAFIEEPSGHSGGVLITFDDGYRDNFDIAFPILRRHGAPATFFLATSLVGSNAIPWWDRLAFCVRRSPNPVIRLPKPWSIELDRTTLGTAGCLQGLLRLYKCPATLDPARLLQAIEEATGVAPAATKRRFLDWNEAAVMVREGMDIGSHTHSHEILSRLTPEAQLNEVTRSRDIIENHLGIAVETLAYPVGGRDSFTTTTIAALKSAGYRAAFSYSKNGINFPKRLERFDLLRLSVDRDVTMPQFNLRVASTALSGRVFV
jgi:peptidoglycan/xylan/chitin deacetylase (PgdA/CDA1 family)